MKTRCLLLPLSLGSLGLLAGCDSLLGTPGEDFRVSTPAPKLDLVQAVAPVDLEFQVDGCDDFQATVSTSGAPAHVLDAVRPLGGGRFVASVAPDLLHAPDDYCTYDAEHPGGGYVELQVNCRQDGRVTTTSIQTSYAPAWRAAYRGRGPSDGVFRGETSDRFYDVGSGWLDGVDAAGVGLDVYAAVAPGQAPLLAASGSSVYLWAGCPINDCGLYWFIDTPSEKLGTNAAFLQVFDFSSGRADFVRNVKVPGDGIDLAVDPDGSVVLLTGSAGSVDLTRVVGDTATSIDLQGETTPTRFAKQNGKRVFLTRVDDGRARLRGSDGALVGEIALPGAGALSYLSLAPTGDALVSFRGDQAWLTTLASSPSGLVTTSTQLPTSLTNLHDNTAEDSSFGAAWTDTGVAIRDRSTLEVYARTAPSTQKWKTTLARTGALIGALGMGDSVVALTQTGLQIFDASGKLVGGQDPMPGACGLDYQPRHAAVVAPDTVALSGKRAVYQFRASLP